MGRKRSNTGEKAEKKTATKVQPIPRKHSGKVTEPYAIMESMIAEKPCFEHLKVAKIKLWWQKDWKADVDGIATGAQCCKASELDRNLSEESGNGTVDLFIKLPRDQWSTLDETEKQHRIFHELCHFRPAMNAEGNQKQDTKDRLLWRMRRHPVAAFYEEIEEFGIDRIVNHNETVVKAIHHADRPMEKIFDASEEKAADTDDNATPNPKAWRRWKVDCLAEYGLPAGKLKLLQEDGLATMGKLMDRMNKTGAEDFWWRDIKGFGETGYDAMVDAMVELRKAKPEFQAA